jgi:hypothetical protein
MVTEGLFLVLVGRARAPVWHVGANYHLERKRPYVNHYSFHILDRDSACHHQDHRHPPFLAQVILNGPEYVVSQARKVGIGFIKDSNGFTSIGKASGFTKIVETFSEPRAVGRLRQIFERWIYCSCLNIALDFEEQQRSGFRYHLSKY